MEYNDELSKALWNPDEPAPQGASDSNAGLGVFTASYEWRGGFGGYDERDYVVVANTESEALGFVLEAAPDTTAKHWRISRLDTKEPGATYLNGRSS